MFQTVDPNMPVIKRLHLESLVTGVLGFPRLSYDFPVWIHQILINSLLNKF